MSVDDFDLTPLERICARIEAGPESGEGLLLYGLLKGMQMEQRGGLFALARLRMLEAETRVEVYALMELYAQFANRAPRWMAWVEKMDEVVGGTASSSGADPL